MKLVCVEDAVYCLLLHSSSSFLNLCLLPFPMILVAPPPPLTAHILEEMEHAWTSVGCEIMKQASGPLLTPVTALRGP